jgi:hypothetical protein
MLRAIRHTRFASLLSVAALVCVLSLSASTLLHTDNDDTICNPAVVVQDHAAHRVADQPAPTSNNPEHCAVCHWLSLRTVPTESLTDLSGAEGSRLFTITVLAFTSATATRRPARAPPAA